MELHARDVARILRNTTLLFLLLTACQTDRRVAEGRFAKRQYTGGWHIDLHRSTKRTAVSVPSIASSPRTHADNAAHASTDIRTGLASPQAELQVGDGLPAALQEEKPVIAEKQAPKPGGETGRQSGSTSPGRMQQLITAPSPGRRQDTEHHEHDGAAGGPEKVNQTAIAGFIFAFLLPPVGIYLCVEAKWQIDRNGERGRILAEAGVVIGITAIVLLLLGILISGMTFSSI